MLPQSNPEKELEKLVARIQHVLEHSTQDPTLMVAAVFEVFLQICTELTDQEFEDSVDAITRLRQMRIKILENLK